MKCDARIDQPQGPPHRTLAQSYGWWWACCSAAADASKARLWCNRTLSESRMIAVYVVMMDGT